MFHKGYFTDSRVMCGSCLAKPIASVTSRPFSHEGQCECDGCGAAIVIRKDIATLQNLRKMDKAAGWFPTLLQVGGGIPAVRFVLDPNGGSGPAVHVGRDGSHYTMEVHRGNHYANYGTAKSTAELFFKLGRLREGFVSGGVTIHDPWVSECGRFSVDPVTEYGTAYTESAWGLLQWTR